SGSGANGVLSLSGRTSALSKPAARPLKPTVTSWMPMSPTASASCSAERPVSAIHNRVFAALPVAVDIRAQLHALLQQQPEAPDIHWVPAANYHITLAFLGDLSGQQLAALCAALNAAKPLPAVTIRLRAIARFPDSSGHIIAAGIHKSAELSRLHKAVL